MSSTDPVRLFAMLEAIAAAFAVVSPHALWAVARWLPERIGPVVGQNDSPLAVAVAILLAGLLLLPGTIALGATLPALVEASRRTAPDDSGGRVVGRLYAANTLGATLGILLTVHVVLPRFGMGIGAVLLAAGGLSAAALGLWWAKTTRPALVPEPQTPPPEIDRSRDPDAGIVREPRLLLALMLGMGLVGIGLEVVGTQILGQILRNTVYTFAGILSVYLIGTAIGAWLYQRHAHRAVAGRPATVAAAMLVALAASVVVSAFALGTAPAILTWLAPAGSGYARHVLAEFGVAAAAFFVPTVLMGAAFTHVAGLLAGRGVGRAYALNTLGSAAAPFVFGVWLIPAAGYRDALLGVAYAYLILFGVFSWLRRLRPPWLIAAVAGVALAALATPTSLVLVQDTEGDYMPVERLETLMGLVTVSEKWDATDTPRRRLQVGRYFQMGGERAFGERRMGHVSLLLAPGARQALFLGVGTGSTLGAAASFALERVDGVELVPEVVGLLHHFDAINSRVYEDPRFTLHAADARRFTAASRERYDVVVADLFHPGRDGAGALYAREHFESVRDHLTTGGVFVQWLPLHQLDLPILRTIVRTFLAVFPDVHSFLGIYNAQTPSLALVGRIPPPGHEVAPALSVESIEAALEKPLYAELLELREMLAGYMLDRGALVAFAGNGPLNTDLHPVVAFDAPRSSYEDPPDLQWTSLKALLTRRTPIPARLLTSREAGRLDALREQIRPYARALDNYLEGDLARVAAGVGAGIPPEAVELYLSAYRAEPGFAPARGMLYVLAGTDRLLAGRIVPEIYERTPDDPRAQAAYRAYLKQIGALDRLEALTAEIRERQAEVDASS